METVVSRANRARCSAATAAAGVASVDDGVARAGEAEERGRAGRRLGRRRRGRRGRRGRRRGRARSRGGGAEGRRSAPRRGTRGEMVSRLGSSPASRSTRGIRAAERATPANGTAARGAPLAGPSVARGRSSSARERGGCWDAQNRRSSSRAANARGVLHLRLVEGAAQRRTSERSARRVPRTSGGDPACARRRSDPGRTAEGTQPSAPHARR